MSQLLRALDMALAKSRDPFLSAELQARKAAYLARFEEFDEAKRLVAEVRAVFNDGRSGRVTCLLQTAEALILYYESFSEQALDKLSRALLLSQAMREADIMATAAVWKAYLEFELSKFESMARSLIIARDAAEPSDHQVQCRLQMVLMHCAILLGNKQQAQALFHKAHHHAVAAGDRASIEALLFNRAVLGFARQRVEWCFGREDASELKFLKGELNSAKNMQQLIGIIRMQVQGDLDLARLLTVQGEFQQAAASLTKLRDSNGITFRHSNSWLLALEIKYCEWKSGVPQDAQTPLEPLDAQGLDGLDPDERLAAFFMLEQLAAAGLVAQPLAEVQAWHEEARRDVQAYEARMQAAVAPLLPTA